MFDTTKLSAEELMNYNLAKEISKSLLKELETDVETGRIQDLRLVRLVDELKK